MVTGLKNAQNIGDENIGDGLKHSQWTEADLASVTPRIKKEYQLPGWIDVKGSSLDVVVIIATSEVKQVKFDLISVEYLVSKKIVKPDGKLHPLWKKPGLYTIWHHWNLDPKQSK